MKAIAIVSGGLDSSAFAAIHKKDLSRIVSFTYGQKAPKEVECAKAIASELDVPFIHLDVSHMKHIFGLDNQLTGDGVAVEDAYQKSVVVPLRNALFLQIGMIMAYSAGLDTVLLGSHNGDCQLTPDGERLYPDCSPEFFKAFELACDLGTHRVDGTVRILTPSILKIGKTHLIKEGSVVLGDTICKSTWSCYLNGEKHCGVCESCRNRKAAFEAAMVADVTEYAG